MKGHKSLFIALFGAHYMTSSLSSAAHDFTDTLYLLLLVKCNIN